MKTKLKQTNGITLIALIITIIILLILAMVSIRILMNEGIIKHAQNATNKYVIAEEKEKIALGYQNYKMDKIANPNAELTVDTATVEGSEAEGGWTITFSETGNVYELNVDGNIKQKEDPTQDEIAKIRAGYNKYVSDKAAINSQIEQAKAEALTNVNQADLDLLTRYCIGNNDKDLINDVLNLETNPWTFKDSEPIPNASKELTYTGIDQAEVNGNYEIYIYFTYNGSGYKLISGFEYSDESGSYPTKKVEPVGDTSALEAQIDNLTLTVADAMVTKISSGWIVEFGTTGHRYNVTQDGEITELLSNQDLIKKYFLGADGKGKQWDDLRYSSGIFKNDAESIEDARSSLKIVNKAEYSVPFIPTEDNQGEDWNSISDTYYTYVEYKNIVYKISLIDQFPEESRSSFYTTKVEKFYQRNGAEGTTVFYSIDGTSEQTEWMVLYDNGETVDIISLNSMGSLTLGSGDNNATNDTNNSNETAGRAINSYNNAIERMNDYCKGLITNPTARKVRSFGTKPDFSNDTTNMFYSNRSIDWDSNYNGILKINDSNSEQDWFRVNYYNISYTGKEYWIARRRIGPSYTKLDGADSYSTMTNFEIASFDSRLKIEDREALLTIYKQGIYNRYNSSTYSKAVRPIVRVSKSDVGL